MQEIDRELHDLLRESSILIVEDDEDVRSLLLKTFSLSGYQCLDAVANGKEAVNKVLTATDAGSAFDLIILDLMLPGSISGEEVYQNLSSVVDIPIIILTAKSTKEAQLKAMQYMDVAEYFIKPIDMNIFLLKCERVLSSQIYSQKVRENHKRNQRLFLNILQVMAKVLETKDPYTRFHSENVAKYARQIARRYGYPNSRLEMIQIAGILHDFGKIGINEEVLNKKGSLTEPEFLSIQRHPMIASAILEPIEELQDIIKDIRHHHERYDGTGYPDGLVGTDIPLGARILCVADAYDAMRSSRSYHNSMNAVEAKEELLQCCNTQFDPQTVAHLLEALDAEHERSGKFDYLKERMKQNE